MRLLILVLTLLVSATEAFAQTRLEHFEKVVETFFDPLGMSGSVPYHGIVQDADKWRASLGQEHLNRYGQSLTKLAQPYTYYGAGETVHDTYPPEDSISAAAGLLSTVRDLARFDIAIDRHVFLKKETQERAWTPFVSNDGERLPYGLGWFVTDWHGLNLVWLYGHWGTGFNNAFVCSFLGLWGYAHDCERDSQALLAKWIEERRAKGRVVVAVHPDILETYVGQYQFEALDNRIFTVTRKGDRLFFGVPGRPEFELFAESEAEFFLKIRPYVLVFTRVEGQRPQLEITQGDETFQSKRFK